MHVSQRTAKRPKVFVLEQQPFDYSPATVYGDLKFVTAQRLAPAAPGAPDNWNKGVISALRKELSDYVPNLDYVVPTGAPSRLVLVGMLLREMGPRHRLLGWDARTQRYIEYTIEVQ